MRLSIALTVFASLVSALPEPVAAEPAVAEGAAFLVSVDSILHNRTGRPLIF